MSDMETLKGEILASIRRVKSRMGQRQALQDADAEFCAQMSAQLRDLTAPVAKGPAQ